MVFQWPFNSLIGLSMNARRSSRSHRNLWEFCWKITFWSFNDLSRVFRAIPKRHYFSLVLETTERSCQFVVSQWSFKGLCSVEWGSITTFNLIFLIIYLAYIQGMYFHYPMFYSNTIADIVSHTLLFPLLSVVLESSSNFLTLESSSYTHDKVSLMAFIKHLWRYLSLLI